MVPPLTERDRNATMSQKRKRVEVDLTGDSDQEEAASAQKAQRGASGNNIYAGGYRSLYGGSTNPAAERSDWLADDVDDVNEIVGSSQDGAEGSEELTLYGELAGKIVGVQYYRGVANAGEHVLIRREPGNPYDSNAIRVDNVAGHQIGHIPRRVAEKLSKYIDNRWLRVEGQLAGEKGTFDCPLTLHMYGPNPATNEGKQLRDRMKDDKLPTTALSAAEKEEKKREKARQDAEKKRAAEEKKRLAEARRAAAGGKGGSIPASQGQYANQHTPGENSQAIMSDILEASQQISPRDFRDDAEQMGMSEDNLSSMSMARKPDAIKTEMLPYQLQALSWLLSQESPQLPGPGGAGDSVQLWSRSRDGYTNLASNYTTKEPALASGGILADDMGLGKTLEMISLIVADAEKCGRGTTLIVAPVSVMSNWTTQVEAHIKESSMLKIYTYHGNNKASNLRREDFEQYDIVLTSYQTLASIYMPGGKNAKQPERKLRATGLYSMEWRRVILDEGHCRSRVF